MTLKRLDLFAFKTFADRTEVEFPSGVTAVVGPNGSGKSNISDAILWALGESNVRHLRGDRAQDVIFAGTGKRKPLGMAEASLTFDNSDGTFGMDEPEVTVTRRVYRSGEGEYFINRTPCRLKDIHDLFLDTGIGRDAYNMVGQSDIDAILSARPEERRQLFEEAAGIKKYRIRKNEALRKLESTSANLVRVSDILSEVDRSIAPLAKAAATARAFRGLDERREGLERVVLAFDASRLNDESAKLRGEAAGVNDALEAARAERAEAEARDAAARLRLTECDRALEEARSRAEELRAAKTRREAERTVLSQRREESARRDAELAETLDALEARRDSARAREAAARADMERLTREQDSLRERLTAARAEAHAERSRQEATARRLSELRAAENRLQTRAAARSGEARAARAEAERLAPAMDLLVERRADLGARKDAAEAAAADAAAETARLQSERAAHAAALAAAEAERAALDARLADAEKRLSALRREAAGLAARRRALAEMAESHEGFYAGVRAVLRANRDGHVAGDLRAVADVLSVPAGLDTAVETALGGQLQDIICPTDAEAKAAIAWLKRENAGRATFLPLDLLRPASRVAARLSDGVVGWAADLVSCAPEYRPAIEMLLGRVLVVETLDVAVALVRRERLPIRVVSRDGEIVSGQGSITGGRGKGGQSHLLARKREREDLGADLERMEREAARLESGMAGDRSRRAEVDESARSLAVMAGEDRLQAAEAARREQYHAAEAARLAREAENAENEAAAAAERAVQRAEQAERLEAEAAAATAELEAVLAEASALTRTPTAPDDERGAALTALEVEAAAVRERLNTAGMETSRAAEDARLAEQDIRRRSEQRSSARAQAEEAATVHESLAGVLEALEASIREAAATLERQRAGRDALLTESAALRERAHAAEERAAASLDRLRKLEVRAAGLESERAHVLLRLREMSDALPAPSAGGAVPPAPGSGGAEPAPPALGEADEAEAPPVTDEEAETLVAAVAIPAGFSRHAAVIEVNRLKREITSLGAVNLAAEEEYEAALDRQAFLRMQHDDLVNAEETLRRTIREIDASTRETFLETFRKVEEHFGVMFRRLFGGGVTRLELTEPDNILETGIDIIVQPPGKKLQNLALLSGGERALTAVALLFAFLKVKPSPFVVLDEVDAPLDEANVGRFASLLREFSANSQFIVITHNRGTMEAAHALYGVTMQEPGVSRLLSLRLEDEPDTRQMAGAYEPVTA